MDTVHVHVLVHKHSTCTCIHVPYMYCKCISRFKMKKHHIVIFTAFCAKVLLQESLLSSKSYLSSHLDIYNEGSLPISKIF